MTVPSMTFLWLTLCPFGHGRPSYFLDFLIMQDALIRTIILHVGVAHLCLCSCMNNCTMPKHTSSNSARADEDLEVLEHNVDRSD